VGTPDGGSFSFLEAAMPDIPELARRLARNVEAVCRHYLSHGRRLGRYWLVGDVHNTPGRSLYVRLHGPDSGKGAAGKWTDAATGEHGDLLDLIAANRGLATLGDTLDEARVFLGLPRPAEPPEPSASAGSPPAGPLPAGSPDAARRLFAMGKPIAGTLAETYLRERGITVGRNLPALRFHPRCYYRPDDDDPAGTRDAWPALLAAVTDGEGTLTGVQRTWLDPAGRSRAPVATPRRAMGHLLGNAVRFGTAKPAPVKTGVLAAGEGIETMLSLRGVLATLPMVAALTANHLAGFALPTGLRRLYITRDNDPAGCRAAATLTERAHACGIETLILVPVHGDFNDDLRELGAGELAAAIRVQLAPEDARRFWSRTARRLQRVSPPATAG